MIGWNTIYFGFEWLVVPFVFVYDLGAQATYDECDHLCLCYRIADATFKHVIIFTLEA